MNRPILWLIALLLLLWLIFGFILHRRNCNCGLAAVPAVVAPVGETSAKSILILDQEKNFKAATNDNLLFATSSCDYETPLSQQLTTVFQQTADYLKQNPQRILILTGLRLGTENNVCTGSRDLGFGRADKVKLLLLGMGAPDAQIRVQSDQREVALHGDKVLGGVQYEFISGDLGDVEKRLRIGNITLHFDSNQKEIFLTSDQQKYFEDLKFFVSQKPEAKISVTGHTDNQSNLAYNNRLSRKRAEFVRDYMVANGIPLDNIVAVGKGPSEPVDSNNTDEGRAKNRRVEVKIQ